MRTPLLTQKLISACGQRDPQPFEGAKAVAVQLCTLFCAGNGLVTILEILEIFLVGIHSIFLCLFFFFKSALR